MSGEPVAGVSNTSAAQEIAEYERDVNTALRRPHNPTLWERTEECTPLDATDIHGRR
jgi:hypothetical protein